MKASVSHIHAIGFGIAGYALWVVGDVFMKLASSIPKYEAMGFAALGGALMVLCISLSGKNGLRKLKPKKPLWLVLLGLCYAVNYILMVWALFRIPLANFYTVTFLAPLTIAVLSPLLLHEQVSWQQGLGIVAGFAGVVIAVNPAGLIGDAYHGMGYASAFICMLLGSAQMMTLRVLGSYETRESMIFFQRLVAFLVAAGICAVIGFEDVTAKDFVCAGLSGAFGSIGWLSMAHAHKLAPASVVAPFHYSRLIFGAILGYLIWQDIPTPHLTVGSVIIIASGLYIAVHTRKAEKLARMLAENSESAA